MKSMKLIDTSMQRVHEIFNQQRDNMEALAEAIASVMENDGVIQLFGAKQDAAFSMELGYRAGGLVQYHIVSPKELVMRGLVDATLTEDDLLESSNAVNLLMGTYQIEPSDAFLIYVSTKLYPFTMELIRWAKERGHKVFVIANVDLLKETWEYSSLLDTVDYLLDNGIGLETSMITLDEHPLGNLSNLVGNMMAQALTLEIYRILKERGQDPQVLWSANIAGADEHNRTITARFDGRWNS